MPWSSFVSNDDTRLGRRLTYILRYAAIDLGLTVTQGGYVVFDDVMQVPSIRSYSRDAVLECVDTDVNSGGGPRFQKSVGSDGILRIRATYNRRIERDRHHDSCKVVRLLDMCYEHVSKDIDRYDVSNLPTPIVNNFIYLLNRWRRLNRSSLLSLAGPNVETLNLTSSYLTAASLRVVSERCTQLRSLILRDQGYLITDHCLGPTLKSLPQLEVLSLRNCSHITDKSVDLILKYTPHLQYLNLVGCALLTQEAKLRCLLGLNDCRHFELSKGNMGSDYVKKFQEAARERKVKVHIAVENGSDH